MLIALPPSEGKARPADGSPLDLAALSFPSLTSTREVLLRTVTRMCRAHPSRAAERLGLGPSLHEEIAHNARLAEAPTARADEVYTGVLYSAWDPATASPAARRRSGERVVIASGLFGLLRPFDPVPAYRLSGDVALPRLGPVAARWRTPLGRVLAEQVGDGLLVDLRSSTYLALHRPSGPLAERTVTVRVLLERDGRRSVVSHANKAAKGRIVRSLLEHDVVADDIAGLAAALGDLGWTTEIERRRLDVVVGDL